MAARPGSHRGDGRCLQRDAAGARWEDAMARKTAALIGSLALVAATMAVSAPPAVAAGTKVVQGHDLAPVGLVEFRDSCLDIITSNPPVATPLGLKGGTLGSHSIG